jgi:hypothetical protein
MSNKLVLAQADAYALQCSCHCRAGGGRRCGATNATVARMKPQMLIICVIVVFLATEWINMDMLLMPNGQNCNRLYVQGATIAAVQANISVAGTASVLCPDPSASECGARVRLTPEKANQAGN